MLKDEYTFHKDWNISSDAAATLSATKLSKAEVKAFFRKAVEKMIPAEYRHKIKYGCRRRQPYHRRYRMPFIIWWLYPGKQLAQGDKKEIKK